MTVFSESGSGRDSDSNVDSVNDSTVKVTVTVWVIAGHSRDHWVTVMTIITVPAKQSVVEMAILTMTDVAIA